MAKPYHWTWDPETGWSEGEVDAPPLTEDEARLLESAFRAPPGGVRITVTRNEDGSFRVHQEADA